MSWLRVKTAARSMKLHIKICKLKPDARGELLQKPNHCKVNQGATTEGKRVERKIHAACSLNS